MITEITFASSNIKIEHIHQFMESYIHMDKIRHIYLVNTDLSLHEIYGLRDEYSVRKIKVHIIDTTPDQEIPAFRYDPFIWDHWFFNSMHQQQQQMMNNIQR